MGNISTNTYYQYNHAILITGNALFIVDIETGKYDSSIGSRLQLTVSSLRNVDDELFIRINNKLKTISSYYAAQCSNGEPTDKEKINLYRSELEKEQNALKLSYEKLAKDLNVTFSKEQIDYIFADGAFPF